MTETETQNDELTSLKRQIRMLSIILFGVCLLTVLLTSMEIMRRPGTNSGWPNMSAENLETKRIVLVTGEGKPAAILGVEGGRASLAFLDSAGDIHLVLGTKDDSGVIAVKGKNEDEATYIEGGKLYIGDATSAGVGIVGPSAGGPLVKVFDDSGYSAQIGRTYVLNHADGTTTVTSTASMTGSSKSRSTTWSLLGQEATPPSPPDKGSSQPEAGLRKTPSKSQ
jgi:hypothetical protein